MQRIEEIASKIGIERDSLFLFGDYIAKINSSLLKKFEDKIDGQLIFVTAMTPTKFGEGKTTTSIGLSDALNSLGYKSIAVLREPSVGPLFGVKGGATGGGKAQIVPMEDINLQFTGDIPAVETAHNLLAALIDNHIFHGNLLNIDPQRISWKRVMDMNDRSLRNIALSPSGGLDKETRESGFDITASSEVMAILCLSKDLDDLKNRLSNIIVGFTKDGHPVSSRDLKAQGAMSAVLRNAINPNLVQSIEGNPVFVHGGPFANIAHGTASLMSIKLALKLSQFAIVEGGFGSDLGGEKFMDIVSRIGRFRPSAVVIVASIRAIKVHGGVEKDKINEINVNVVKKGLLNLQKHIENIKSFGLPVVVALNKFSLDKEVEIEEVKGFLDTNGIRFAISEAWEKGSEGSIGLAKEIVSAVQNDENNFHFLYGLEEPIVLKIEKVAHAMYGARNVIFKEKAKEDLDIIDKIGVADFPVCMAKTQLSLSDDPKILGRPEGFDVTVKEIRVLNGAGFVVPICGELMTMPGLPKAPAAEGIDIVNGKIIGLF